MLSSSYSRTLYRRKYTKYNKCDFNLSLHINVNKLYKFQIHMYILYIPISIELCMYSLSLGIILVTGFATLAGSLCQCIDIFYRCHCRRRYYYNHAVIKPKILLNAHSRCHWTHLILGNRISLFVHIHTHNTYIFQLMAIADITHTKILYISLYVWLTIYKYRFRKIHTFAIYVVGTSVVVNLPVRGWMLYACIHKSLS